VIGAIAHATERLRLGTGVTCPTSRIHPAIIAQAAATAADMMPERFMLGVGSGENLNEHVVGVKWQPPAVRLEMLKEALEVIRALWTGELRTHRGKYYTVDQAQLFSLPAALPPILMAAAKPRAAQLAGEIADGLISTVPQSNLVQAFRQAGGEDKPRIGQVTVCWAESDEKARRQALKIWPNALVSGQVSVELPLPRHFEQLTEDATEEEIEKRGEIICGPDPEKHVAAIRKFIDAGYDQVYIHQIGPQQVEFLKFSREQILPHFVDEDIAQSSAGRGSEATP
jgi:G6PDH family F420-dependent oxidoreductase